MLRKFHKTTSEHWWRTSGTQKGSPFSSKGGRTKYKRQKSSGWRDHFLSHKFIKRTFECQENSTKQLLNAGRGHQAPRKAAHCLQKEVGQKIQERQRGRDGDLPQEGSLKKREKFPNTRKHSPVGLW